MNIFAFIIVATVFESVGDAVMRLALRAPYASHVRAGFFALASLLLALYGLFLNLPPIEFATVTGLYIASLFVMFQVVNYLFFRTAPTPAVLVGGTFILVGAAIVYFWK